MKRSGTISIPLTAAAAALVALSCGEEPTTVADVAGPAFHHRPGHGGGNGGGGGGGEFPVTIEVRNASGDRITSQGSVTYVDDADGNLRIRDDGRLLWNVNEGRGFNLDFTQEITGGGGLPADHTVTRVGALRVLASEDPTDELDGGLLGMAYGDSLPATLKTRAEFDADGTYQLRFQRGAGGQEAIADSIATGSSFLTVVRRNGTGPCSGVVDAGCWTVEGLITGDGPGTQDDWSMVFHKTGRGNNVTFTDEGSYHMPFRWTVICADCPPASSSDSPPNVTVTSPSDGATVSGTIAVTADASDDHAVSQVEFFTDGSSLGVDSDGSDGWSASWDTGAEADGSSHTVAATATDDAGQTASDQVTVTVDNSAPSTMHVGDLDSNSINNGRNWTAEVTIAVHDGSHNAVADATVSGDWSGLGGGSADSSVCTTDSAGQCTVRASGMRKNNGTVAFTVDGVEHGSLAYQSGDNHDPDGDSDGTSITVSKP